MNKVLLVDDHPIYRRGMASLIEAEEDLQLCAEADSVPAALRLFHDLTPDVLVVDLSLGEGSGLQLIKSVRARDNQVPILVISMYAENLFAERVIKAGANGYLNKAEAVTSIIEAIRHVLRGKLYLSKEMAEQFLCNQLQGKKGGQKQGEAGLSDREMEVYMMLGLGYTSKRIAAELHVSSKTVDSHKEHIKEKLGITDNTSLIRRAVTWLMER